MSDPGFPGFSLKFDVDGIETIVNINDIQMVDSNLDVEWDLDIETAEKVAEMAFKSKNANYQEFIKNFKEKVSQKIDQAFVESLKKMETILNE